MVKSVAVWNTAFLGDAVLTLPLLAAVGAAFPAATLDFYVRPGLASLFAAQTVEGRGIRVTEVPRRGFLKFLLETVRPRKHDLWLGAHPSPRAAFAAFASGAAVRVGYSGGGRWFGYNLHIPRRFGELDEIERLLQLLKPVQQRFPGTLPASFAFDDRENPAHFPNLVLPQDAEAAAEQFFCDHDLVRRPVLGIHPGSVWPTKRWGGFATVARKAADAGCALLVFGGPGEEAMATDMIVEAGLAHAPNVHNLGGALSLPVLAAYIRRLSAYTGNDSGPLHLAWIQGVPVTAVFGPTVRELGFFPRAATPEMARVVEIALPCRPCGLHGPKTCPLGHHRCMRDISPDAVWSALQAQLRVVQD